MALLKVYFRFLIVGFIMMGLTYVITALGMKYMSLPIEVLAFAVGLAGAMILFRGLTEFIRDVISGEYKKKSRNEDE
ncbi:hypothetical protein SE86_07360 [Acidilobus sp. 7A]|nr:hypothetical protein SE86_07360 [Acidilobus sp. 7A]